MPERLRAVLAEKNQTREYLSDRSLVWTEQYTSPNGMAGVVAHWGVRRPRAAMHREIERTASEFGVAPKLIHNSGFDEIYRMPIGYNDEEIAADAKEVGIRLTTRVLGLRGWKPEEVDYLDFGSSVGKGDTARELAVELGLVNAQTLTARLACNSAGHLLDKRLQDEAALGKKVLLLDVDPITGLLRDPQKTDDVSRQIFSNGAGGLAYQPGVDLVYLNGVAIERRDTMGITAIAPYQDEIGDWTGDETHVIFTDDKGNSRVVIQKPPDGKDFWMRGIATASFFIQLAAETIASVHQQYRSDHDGGEFDFIVGHQASEPVFSGVKSLLARPKYGIDLQSNWGAVRDGNSSSATSLIAFVRSMSKYKPGDHGLYASYGAGGSANCFAVEIGAGTS